MGVSVFTLVTGLLILIGDLADSESSSTCSGDWEHLRRHCYLFVSRPNSSWFQARDGCEDYGARLVSIETDAERKKIKRRLRHTGKDSQMEKWWVGLHKVGDSWQWVDGRNFSDPKLWNKGEPNNERGNENCTELLKNGKLNDIECNATRPYICKKQTEVGGNERTGGENQPPDSTDQDDDNDPVSEKGNKGGKGGKKDKGVDLQELYAGCYMKGSAKKKEKGHNVESTVCPLLNVSGTTWPETDEGVLQSRPCRQGNGNMTFKCGGDPVCWRGEPNRDQCASRAFRSLLNRFSSQEEDAEAPDPEETLGLTSELANVTEGDVTEEDIAATSKLIQGLVRRGAARKIRGKKNVETVVMNVVRAGSNLVSRNKSAVWKRMDRQDKIRSATSLLVAMETATVAMAEELEEPTTIISRDDNIELEVRVVNVTSRGGREDVVYRAKDSPTRFSIPLPTLRHLSSDGLARTVFMTHYTMHDILGNVTDDDTGDNLAAESDDDEADEAVGENTPVSLASLVVSASMATGQNTSRLPEPVSFTINHLRRIPKGFQSLCSFWSIDNSGWGAWSQEGCRKVEGGSNDAHTQCQCDHMTNFAVLMTVQKVQVSEEHSTYLRVVTIVGCVISCLCLMASWLTFTCFSSLQGERNSVHKHLVACLFVAELLFLIGIDRTENRVVCGVVAGFLHYVFLAAFLWMMMEGVHILLMLVQVFDAARSRLPFYYAAAYGPPLLIVAISAGVFPDGYGTDHYCWLTTERGLIWSFTGPVAAILFVNSVVLIYAMTMVCRHSDYVFSAKDKSSAGSVRTWIQGALALEVVLGVTWLLGFFFLSRQSVALAYLFTILNSTQGLFIFLLHCLLNKKARKEYRRVMQMRRQPSSTGTGTGTGTGTHSASLAKNKLSSGASFNEHNASQHPAPSYL